MSLNARDTNSHPTRHQARYNTACVALSTHTHQKVETCNVTLLSQLPNYCGDLNKSEIVLNGCMWLWLKHCHPADGQLIQTAQTKRYAPFILSASVLWDEQPEAFFYQHPAIVLTSHLCEEKPKKQSKFLTKAVDSCRCFVTLHKRISWWTMASSLADTSPYNPNNVASVALLTTLTTYH